MDVPSLGGLNFQGEGGNRVACIGGWKWGVFLIERFRHNCYLEGVESSEKGNYLGTGGGGWVDSMSAVGAKGVQKDLCPNVMQKRSILEMAERPIVRNV